MSRALILAALSPLLLAACGRVAYLGIDEGGLDASPVDARADDAGDLPDAGSGPDEMVYFADGPRGPFYIDRYEASRVPGVGDWGDVDQDLDADGRVADRAVAEAHGVSHGMLFDDDGGEEAVRLTTAVARSAPTADPAAVSFFQAAAACLNAGKRLCTGDEWRWACQGGPISRDYPYEGAFDGGDEAGRDCWTHELSVGPRLTGTASACVSPEGVYDLSGNMLEWTDYGGTSDSTVRGGSWGTSWPPSVSCSSTILYPSADVLPDRGFRCCRDGL